MRNKWTHEVLDSLNKAAINPSLSSLVSEYQGYPFIIYGAGPAGRCTCDILLNLGVKPECILDANANSLPSDYAGIPIFDLKQQNFSDSLKRIAIVLVCVIQGRATHTVIKKNLLREGFFTIIPWPQKAFSPDAMKESKCIEPKLEDYRELILSCAEIFEDDLSRNIYSNLMTACILRKFEGLAFIDSEEQYFPLDIEMTKGYRSFMDCGAFCGDTLENLVKKNLTPKIYIAFEPDWRNFSKITRLIEEFNIDKALLFPCALSRNTMPLRFTLDQVHSGAGSSIDPNGEYLVQCVAIDECLKGIEPTFIKIDIEGNEIEALIGAKKTIARYRPDIAVAIYHYADHYFKIPNLLHRWNLGYRFHIRTYDYFGNETILYATCPSH